MAHKTHTLATQTHACTNRPTQYIYRRNVRVFRRFRDKRRTGRLHRYVCEHGGGELKQRQEW